MPSKKTKPTSQTTPTDPVDPTLINSAIDAGQSVLSEGKPKIEAAMTIYRILENIEQQTVVSALIKGANLTPMGAVTYWYNCRRRLSKERQSRTR
jgi:hypothetical protein